MDTDDKFCAATEMRIRQIYYRKRLARLTNRVDIICGCEDTIKKPHSWGNASPEMLTGGIKTTSEMRDALREIESEVA